MLVYWRDASFYQGRRGTARRYHAEHEEGSGIAACGRGVLVREQPMEARDVWPGGLCQHAACRKRMKGDA